MRLMSFALLLSASAITACTEYQADGFTGGYTETWLAEDAVKVGFAGNAYTSSERTADFSLLRVAELGKAKGYEYFVLLSENTNVTSFQTPSSYQVSGSGGAATITQTGGVEYSKPSSENTAKFLRTKPRNFSGIVYEASFICRSISGKYELVTVKC